MSDHALSQAAALPNFATNFISVCCLLCWTGLNWFEGNLGRTFNFCRRRTRKNLNGLGLILASDISARDISALRCHHGEFSAQQHFGPRTFQHGNILVPWTFGTGTLRHWDISEQGYLCTWIFWHHAKQDRHFWTDISAQTFLLYAKKSMCCNVTSMVPENTHTKMFLCRHVLVLKSPFDEMSVPKCLLPKCQVPN